MTLPGESTLFFRKTVGGKTVPTWPTKMLVWLMPALFISIGLVLLVSSFIWVMAAEEATGTVVKVNEWIDKYSGEKIYAPVFSYQWSDGTINEASLRTASPAFNPEIGSTHTILFDPEFKDNIRLTDFVYNYMIGLVIMTIGVMFMLISLLLWIWVNSIARNRDIQPKASS